MTGTCGSRAQLLGVNVADVFNALQVFIGSSYVNDFNLFGRTYLVFTPVFYVIVRWVAGLGQRWGKRGAAKAQPAE